MAFRKQGYRLARLVLVLGGAGLVVLGGCVQVLGLDKEYSKGSGGGSGGSMSGGSSSSGESCPKGCSNDLKRIVDCQGLTLATCTADQGCFNGACEADPCAAAAKEKSSIGCDYWAVKTAQRLQASGACFSASVANIWEKPTKISVEFQKKKLDPSSFAYLVKSNGSTVDYAPYPATGVPPGRVAILFLSRAEGASGFCPKPAATELEAGVVDTKTFHAGTGIGNAFHILTDHPSVVHQFNNYGGAGNSYSAASLLIATSGWGQSYEAINAYHATPSDTGSESGRPSLSIVANQDQTDVSITPNDIIHGSDTVLQATKGTEAHYSLNTGEFLQFTQPEELTGSPITSNKPIGVFGAADCMTVPLTQNYCDPAVQQLPPMQGTGHEYVAVRYKNRIASTEESPPWRLVGMKDGTTLTWIPDAPAEAPKTLERGEVAEFSSPGPFIVKSQDRAHPFYLGAYMTGGAPYMNIGDPEWVNVIAPDQYLDKYVFPTDPSFPDTSLVVVRPRSKITGNFEDVTIDCSYKPLDGWQSVGDYEYTRFDVGTNGPKSIFCERGPQVMKSAAPFGVTVWGWGSTMGTLLASYAFPAGAGYHGGTSP